MAELRTSLRLFVSYLFHAVRHIGFWHEFCSLHGRWLNVASSGRCAVLCEALLQLLAGVRVRMVVAVLEQNAAGISQRIKCLPADQTMGVDGG